VLLLALENRNVHAASGALRLPVLVRHRRERHHNALVLNHRRAHMSRLLYGTKILQMLLQVNIFMCEFSVK